MLSWLYYHTGLENSTHPPVFTGVLGSWASENFDITSENYFFPVYENNFCDAGQVPISRYFEPCHMQLKLCWNRVLA